MYASVANTNPGDVTEMRAHLASLRTTNCERTLRNWESSPRGSLSDITDQFDLGACLEWSGRATEARGIFAETLERAPDHVAARRGLARLPASGALEVKP